jgi:tetratricopeptide (TPR) repeat protein
MLRTPCKKYFHVSKQLKPARNAFLIGETKNAFTYINDLRHKKYPLVNNPEDIALLRDIYVSAGHPRTAMAIVRIAVNMFPNNIFVQLIGIILKTEIRNSIDLLQEATALKPLCKTSKDITLWYAVIARISASLGMMASSADWLKKAESSLEDNNIEAWYHFCLAHALRCDWTKAVEQTKLLINIDPSIDNKILLIKALLSKNDLSQAKLHIKSIDVAKGQSYSVDYFVSQFYYFLGDIDAAISRLELLRHHWPDIPHSSVDRTLIQLYWLHGNTESAKSLARAINDPLYGALNKTNPSAKRKLITLPVMRQEPMMCLPTTIAMVASVYGIQLSASELYHDMRGNHGTEIWRMQQHMESIGFEVNYIYPEHDIVKKCLDKGQPLIGIIHSFFNVHTEVITGYDEGLNGYFIRDPEALTPYLVSTKHLDTAYNASGRYLIATAPKNKFNWLPKLAINHDISNLFVLNKLIAFSQLKRARRYFNEISDKQEPAYYRDLSALGVFLSPKKHIEAMKCYCVRKDIDEVLVLNAIISTQNSVLLKNWIFNYESKHKKLSNNFKCYLSMILARTKRDYETVLKKLNFLIAASPSTDVLWCYKAEAELELGELEAAKNSINIALDLSPNSFDINRILSDISPYQDSYKHILSQLEAHINIFPGNYELEEQFANLLLKGNDGLRYENAIKSCIAKRPLFPWNYNKLANWYILQEREDLAINILEQGRHLLSEEELPKLHFERQKDASHASQSISGIVEDKDIIITDKAPIICFRNIIQSWFDGYPLSEFEIMLLRQADPRNIKWLYKLPLSWWEQAYIIGISYVLKDRETDKSRKAHVLERFLPKTLSNNVTQTLLAINRSVERYSLSSVACECLHDWETKQLNGYASHLDDLAFSLSYLRESAGYLNEAHSCYEEIIKRTPEYYPAHYRLACVYDQKGMRTKAIERYQSCLSISPNHPDALNALIRIHTEANHFKEAKKWSLYKLNLNPYSFLNIEQLLIFTLYIDGFTKAWKKLDFYNKYLSTTGKKAMSARLLESNGQYQDAINLLVQINGTVDFDRHILITHTRCATGQENWSLVLELSNKALAKDPYDLWFLEAKVTALENNGFNQLHKFITKLFCNSIYSEYLATVWLRDILRTNNDVHNSVNEILTIIPEESIRLYILYFLTGYFEHYSNNIAFLTWLKMCDELFPNNFYFVERLVEHYRKIDNADKAIDTADNFYKNNTENIDAIILLGQTLENDNPSLAIKYLQTAYRKSGSVECLSRIGRTYHNLGMYQEAKNTYWEVLMKNPFNELSINNLLILGEDPSTLYPLMVDAINNGIGYKTEYFLVSTVKCALHLNTTVPLLWHDLAESRFSQLLSVAGYQDEKPCLAKALYEWHQYHGNTEIAESYLQHAGLIKPTTGGFNWPGNTWIPTKNIKKDVH